MIDIEISIWIATKTRWAHLIKVIAMPAVPRVGEFIKFNNAVVGNYLAFRVSEVTYRECGRIEVCTELLNNIDERMYSFEEETEFDEYFNSYLAEGWQCLRCVGPNRQFSAARRSVDKGDQQGVGPNNLSHTTPIAESLGVPPCVIGETETDNC